MPFSSLLPLARSLSTATDAALANKIWQILRQNTHKTLERSLALSNLTLTPRIINYVVQRSNSDEDRALALRFFVWAGTQKGQRHSDAVYEQTSNALNLTRNKNATFDLLDRYADERSLVSIKTFKILLNLMARSNAMPDDALSILRRMPEFGCRPDMPSYNAVLKFLVDSGCGDEIDCILDEIKMAGLRLDNVSYVLAIRGFANAGKIGNARKMLEEMTLQGCVPNVVVYTALVEGACQCGDVDAALEILEGMEGNVDEGCAPNVVTYTSLMKFYCGKGRMEDALEVLDRMRKRGCFANQEMVRTLIDGFCAKGCVSEVYELIDRVVDEGKVSKDECFSLFLVSLLNVGDLDGAQELLGNMMEKGIDLNGFACNSMLRRLNEEKQFLHAYSWLMMMEENGFMCVNSDVYAHLLQELCEEGHLVEAMKLTRSIVEKEIMLPEECANSVVEMLNKHDDNDDLIKSLMRLKQPQEL